MAVCLGAVWRLMAPVVNPFLGTWLFLDWRDFYEVYIEKSVSKKKTFRGRGLRPIPIGKKKKKKKKWNNCDARRSQQWQQTAVVRLPDRCSSRRDRLLAVTRRRQQSSGVDDESSFGKHFYVLNLFDCSAEDTYFVVGSWCSEKSEQRPLLQILFSYGNVFVSSIYYLYLVFRCSTFLAWLPEYWLIWCFWSDLIRWCSCWPSRWLLVTN